MFAGQDLRFALRLLRRTPLVTGAALVSIALSVGATAVVFTAIKSVLLDPLPYARPEKLVQIRTDYAGAGPSQGDWIFWRDAQEIIRRTRTLQAAGLYGNVVFNLAGDPGSPPEAFYGVRISAGLLPVLGVLPMLGRNILPEEDRPGRANVMLLSYGFWKRRFQGDPGIVGRRVAVNGQDCAIIGVMPPGFNFPLRRGATHTPSPYVEFWSALRMDPEKDHGALGMVARLRPGVPLSEAAKDLASIGTQLAREFPATDRDRTLHMGLLRDRTIGKARYALWLLMGAVLMFLLIGCANVANLLLARGLARQREIAVRMAVGAGRTRIFRQLLTESGVLAVLGGLGGYGLSVAAWKILPAVVPVSIPRLAAGRADQAILAFALAVAVLNGFLFGLVPALRSARSLPRMATSDLGARGGAAGKQDLMRATLVSAEVAITVTLALTGGQFLAGFVKLMGRDPGFDPDRVLASVVLPPLERYPTAEQRGLLYRRFLDAVRALPGVVSAGTVDALPFSGENHGGFVTATSAGVNDPKARIVAEVDLTGGDYLQAMGVQLREGRWFREEEMREASEAAIVDEIAARRLWPGGSAIGRRVCVFCSAGNPENWKRVVGVVSSVRHAALDGPAVPSVYMAGGALSRAAFLVVRTSHPPGDLVPAIRRAIAGVDPNQPVLLSASMRTLLDDSIADRRFVLSLLSLTAILALLLSAAGVYGVMSYTISRRTQEIGVRMALGATPGRIHALVFRQGLVMVSAGFVVGMAGAATLMGVLRGTLAGFERGGPASAWAAGCLVALTAAIACWVPARRATRIDPLAALRQE
jgi:putative ABC transport system permease protein